MSKRITSTLLVIVILVASATAVLAAVELVTNGDFSAGLANWTTTGGTSAIDDGCGAGVAKLSVGAGPANGSLTQCIVVDDFASPTDTGWTLSADIRLISGFLTGVEAQYFNNPNCSGGQANVITVSTNTPSGALATFTSSEVYDPPPNSSVLIVASLNTIAGAAGEACFDNISLTAYDPTAVTLASVDARSPLGSPWAIVLAVSFAAILGASALLLRQRALPTR